ncbi:MAG: hypothetical protein IJS69_01065 [Selenomonadaceae bacterium]|nr:hypothetical protein [Selenomonadaceae bacterium]MBQ4404383.1 hypothetical protein [Selenomonadaceae bacterium]MBQ7453635.1 hypothetical protein [Selenomonadaceae bacterium]
MLKKIREFFQKKDSEKGQGAVEYALVLGFVAIIAVYLLTGSGLQTSTKTNIANTKEVSDQIASDYATAKGTSSEGSEGSESESNGNANLDP